MTADTASLTTLEGHLERITYYNQDNHFTIAKLRTAGVDQPVTVLGHMPDPNTGEALRVTGSWQTHPKYGQQLRITAFETVLPATVEGIKDYLASGFIKGVGPKTVSRMVNHFGKQTLAVIESEPNRLTEVKGIGAETVTRITGAWKKHHHLRQVIQYLQENDLKTSHAAKISKQYGSDTMDVLRDDPFRLAHDFPGFGFFIADTLMQKAGIAADDPERVQACALHILRRYVDEGNAYTRRDQLIERCEHLFGIESQTAQYAIDNLVAAREVVLDTDPAEPEKQAIYLNALFTAEAGIAVRMNALLSHPTAEHGPDRNHIISEVLHKLAIELPPEQLEILESIFSHRTAIITGGPGTGKTTLIRSITAIYESLGKQVILGAPTGRAARRLSEVSRKEAGTIHKILGLSPGEETAEWNRDHPLQADVFIIDEASMIDTFLMFHLINAIHITSRLILVGDVFQLPAVGPGNVLADLIQSRAIPTYELKKIFRQARESRIIRNAHRIRLGDPPIFERAEAFPELSDFYFVEQQQPEAAAEMIVDLCLRKIPERFSFDPVRDIQILTPMHKGVVGTLHLNQLLQEHLNPNPITLRRSGRSFKPDDKVMHLINNYHKEIFNGDSGTICDIDLKNEIVSVSYDSGIIDYEFSELDEISLAYAITVHKAQGSEYPAVIVPIMTQHFAMLQRNLLYTAITRGKQLVVVIGTQKALGIALKNNRPQQRLSGLFHRLQGAAG